MYQSGNYLELSAFLGVLGCALFGFVCLVVWMDHGREATWGLRSALAAVCTCTCCIVLCTVCPFVLYFLAQFHE